MDMKHISNILVIFCAILQAHALRGQSLDTALLSPPAADSALVRIAVRAKFQDQAVMLRWAPSMAGGWALLNRIGYTVQRREITDNGASAWIDLTEEPVKPRPLEDWQRFGDDTTNAYPLIAAQALYGKEFGNQPALRLADKADELTNRYSFVLLAADLSFETAQYAGLAFIDRAVQPGKLYAYRIFAAAALVDYFPADTGEFALQTVAEPTTLRPVWRSIDEHEHRVTLHWDKHAHQSAYTAYYIERSADGNRYRRLNSRPYIQFDNPALELDNPDFTYADSLAENYQPYWYRLVGIDAFGQPSEPSDPIQGMGRDRTPPAAPTNLRTTILADGTVELTWDVEVTTDLAGFLIGRSAENSLSGFEPLTETPLATSTRRYVDATPRTDAPNYYIVAATDTAKNAAVSMAAHVAFIDSIPPSPPTTLAATIDTLGVLTLSWAPSPARDVMGYIVSYANDSTHFFTSAVDRAIPDTVFTDTLSLATLSEEIHYRVRAVDHHHNTSVESAILTVKKPDLIPPVAPQFTDFRVEEKRVTLTWIPSSSKDVAAHETFRREQGKPDWEPVAFLPIDSAAGVFADTLFKPNTRYEYMIQAIDDAGLRSPESAIVRIRTLANLRAEGPVSFTVQRPEAGSVLIQWALKPATDSDVRVVIYRAVNGGAFETLASFGTDTFVFEDRQISTGSTYEYTCKLHYSDGRSSSFYAVQRLAP